MTEKDVVKKFIDSPLHISDDVLSGYGDKAKHYRDLVCLLHLLLVKHEEKKGFVFASNGRLDNTLKICMRLKLLWEKPEFLGLLPVIPKSRKMDEKMADVLVKIIHENYRVSEDPTNPQFVQQEGSFIVCSMDKPFLQKIISDEMNQKKFAKIEEYPKCCVDAFIEREWDDFEILVTLYDQQEIEDRDLEINDKKFAEYMVRSLGVSAEIATKVSWVIKNHGYYPQPHPLIGRNNARLVWSYVQTSEKYPFLIHSACKNCLCNENSLSAKMNGRFSRFCKNRYPELHESIIVATKSIVSVAPSIKSKLEAFHGVQL